MKKANYTQFNKLISRATPLELTPEVKLILAVLTQAWADAASNNNREAIQFFMDGRAGKYGEVVGLDADFIKETFMKHHPKSYEALPYVS
jgi:hypothetical protein